jgi:hypothetical protein
MLEKNGFGDEKSAATFVQKYNATVFYDDSLSLKENAGKRQARAYIFVRQTTPATPTPRGPMHAPSTQSQRF